MRHVSRFVIQPVVVCVITNTPSQCIMPALKGLMPRLPNNRILLDLCFDSAIWHALAKLREHTEDTLDGLDKFTVKFGKSVRIFAKKTFASYVTVKLPKEAARGRCTAATTGMVNIYKKKVCNCNTYKLHAMRDYLPSIRAHASTDNNSTQIVRIIYLFVLSTIKHTYSS